jgi:hypothetical protein
MIIFGAIAGIVAGAIMILFSHLASRYGAARYVREIDVIVCFGRTCTRRESHIIGITVHMILYAFFGLLYAVLAEQGVVAGFGAMPLCIYAILVTLTIGGIFLPLEGHGLFGMREDKWFMIDLALANLGWIILYGAFMGIWR